MNEEVILNSGYKKYEVPVWKNCDRFYQKKIDDKRYFNVYYYDTFKEDGSLDYKFEYEYIEDRENYWYNTNIWALDKNYPYTIGEIERLLLNE